MPFGFRILGNKMDVTASRLALLAGAGSLVILLAAFGFQYIGELAPCDSAQSRERGSATPCRASELVEGRRAPREIRKPVA